MRHNPQSQFELFPGEQDTSAKKSGSRFFLGELTFSPENFIVLGIVLIMSMVVSFSLGVERGKRTVLAKKNLQNQRVTTPKSRIEISPKGKTDSAEGARRQKIPVPKREIHPVFPQTGGNLAVSGTAGERNTILEKNAGKIYTIQVASFQKEETAQIEAMGLKKKGYEKILVLPKGNYSIVCVGKFARRNEAKVFSKKLKKQYKDCLIRSL